MAVTRIRYANDSGSNSFFVVIGTSVFTLNQSDRYVIVQISAPTVFALPASPVAGERHTFVDDSGNLTTALTATVNGNGKTINGSATYVMYLPRKAVTVQYNGTQWDVLEEAGPATLDEGAATSRRITWPLMHGVVATPVGPGTPLIIGSNLFDPVIAVVRKTDPGYTATVNFKAILATTVGSSLATVDLIDVNNVLGNGAGASVPGSTLSTSSTGQTFLTASVGALTVNTTTGIFSARLWLNPTASGQQAICYMARIDVDYTVFAP